MPVVSLPTGLSLYYEIHGAGHPLLLIMGTSADHGYWGYQVAEYAKSYRVIVYDSRGTGQSSTPSDPTTCSMAVMADDAKALLDSVGVEQAHVAGLSLGATVAQELALRHPQVVLSLQLHGAWAGPDPAFVYAIECMKYPLLLDDYPGFVRTAFAWILTAEFLNDDSRRESMLKAVLGNPYPPRVKGILGHLHADLTHDVRDRLSAIRCPTLVTSGERDIQVPPRLGREVARLIPGATFSLFVGGGSSHLTCVERADDFNHATLAWLEKLHDGVGHRGRSSAPIAIR